MPILVDSWNESQIKSYIECTLKESPYIFDFKGNVIRERDGFSLEEYKKGKSGEYIVRDNNLNKVAGNLFAYVFSYNEIKIDKGLMIDNPFIYEEYKGKGLTLWSYNILKEIRGIPLVSSLTQTRSLLRSVWLKYSDQDRVNAINKKTGEEILFWKQNNLDVTHGIDGRDWILYCT